MTPARRRAWAEIIAADRTSSARRSVVAWHHGSPQRKVLDVPDPPFRSGRYHRAGGNRTWYGSSTESAAWAEFVRSLPDSVDSSEFRRRLGRVDFYLLALDLTSPTVQSALGIKPEDLVSDDLSICQALADLAVEAGFEAVIGPSAAALGETTLAIFGAAIRDSARKVVDRGVRTPPSPR